MAVDLVMKAETVELVLLELYNTKSFISSTRAVIEEAWSKILEICTAWTFHNKPLPAVKTCANIG